MRRSIPKEFGWDGNDPDFRHPKVDRLNFEVFRYTTVANYAWKRTLEDYPKERDFPTYVLQQRKDYFEKLCKQVTTALVNKVEETAKKHYSKFDRTKTILDNEVLNEGLAAAEAILDSEIAKLPKEGPGVVFINESDKKELVKIESEMLELVAMLEGSPSATLKDAANVKGRRLEAREAVLKQRTLIILLEFFKQKLIKSFQERYILDPPKNEIKG